MVESFDLQRIFFGDQPLWFLLEIAFRTIIIFTYTLLLVRLMGKRGMGQLSPFDFVIIIALGSAVGDPMFYPNVPLVHTMIVITVVVLLQRGLALLTAKNRSAERFVESDPQLIVSNGILMLNNLHKERMAQDEALESLRLEGLRHLGEVEWAFLEPSGALSVLRAKRPKAGLVLLPRTSALFPEVFTAGVVCKEAGCFACTCCGFTMDVVASEPLGACVNCQHKEWVVATEPLKHADGA